MILSGFKPQPLSFSDQELSDRMFREQCAVALAFLPAGLCLGHIVLRIGAHNPPFLRADLWNSILRLILADIVVELLQHSMGCIPFEEEDDISEVFLQSIGVGCPLYARPLAPKAALWVYGMRLIALLFGIYIGEGWMPVALTGGIASGKSLVADQLLNGKPVKKEDETTEDSTTKKEPIESGTVYIVDSDKISHSLLLQSTSGNVYKRVVSKFGKDILNDDDVIDRAKLGARVFSDASERRTLNSIIHPRIFFKLWQKILWGLYIASADMTVAEVPLLFDLGSLTRFWFVLTVCVRCTPEQQLERLRAKNPDMTEEECLSRINSQLPMETKAHMAHIVVDNTKGSEELEENVEKLREELMMRLYGVGLTLFQIIGIMGISLPIAIYYKIYQHQKADGDAPKDLSSA